MPFPHKSTADALFLCFQAKSEVKQWKHTNEKKYRKFKPTKFGGVNYYC